MGIEVQPAPAGQEPTTAEPTPDVGYAMARAGRRKLISLSIVSVAFLVVSWVILPTILYQLADGGQQPAPATHAVAVSGAELYEQHCANCHGRKGDGNGPTALGLWPKPRNFGEGKFRLKTTTTGAPCDEDLLAVLRNGIPGSAMPAFPQFSEDELKALVAHVRVLTRGGIYERLCRKAEEDGDEPTGMGAIADRQCEVGPTIEIPKQFPPATPESLARGKEHYFKTCVACHGPEGKGDGPQVAQMKNDDGSPARPRDFTTPTYKGGRDPAALYARIVIGMPGSPMPGSPLMKPEEVGDLINYVLSLSTPAGADVAQKAE